MITIDEAKGLMRGTILYHVSNRNCDGTPQRWRVNGVPQLWKRNPERVRVPVKNGLYTYGYITEDDLQLISLAESAVSR